MPDVPAAPGAAPAARFWAPNPWLVVAGGLLFLMLFVPTAYRSTKMFLLGLVLLGVLAPVLRSGRIFLHRSIVRWTMLMVLTGVCGVVIGVPTERPVRCGSARSMCSGPCYSHSWLPESEDPRPRTV